jgi:hypothetical protein|tara:strand:- start:891 stop:1442 length:552 start_codon:yes stop_codon:yes gene_type:complete
MKIELELQLLEDTEMSADEFVALYLIYRDGFDLLNRLNLNPNWEKLQQEGYIKLGETRNDHVVRQEFIDLFTNSFDAMFAELIGTYPMKVSTTTGIRILHAKDPDAYTNLKCKNKYKKIVKTNSHTHRAIMTALNTQLTLERNSLAYLQNLETWLNNHTWEKYQDIDINDNSTSEPKRITRKL